jgi:hypothetical protein
LGETVDEEWGKKQEPVLNSILRAFQERGGNIGAQ